MGKRAFFTAIFGTFAVVAACFILLPTFFSSTLMKEYAIVPLINSRTGGKTEIGSLHFSWFGKQRVTGFKWKSDDLELGFKELKVNTSPFDIVRSFSIDGFTAKTNEGEVTNLSGTGNWEMIDLHGESSGGPISLTGPPAAIEFKAEKLPAALFGEAGRALFGKSATLQGKAMGNLLRFDVESDALNGTVYFGLDGTVPQDGTLTFKPTEIFLKRTNLVSATPFKISFPKEKEPKVYVQTDKIGFQDGLDFHYLDSKFSWNSDLVNYELKGQLIEKGVTAALKGSGTHNILFPERTTLTVTGDKVPSSFFLRFLPNDPEVKAAALATVGPWINFEAAILDPRDPKSVTVEGDFNTGNLSKAHFRKEGDSWTLTQPAIVELQFSPTTYFHALNQKPADAIQQNLPVQIVLNRFSYPNNFEAQGTVTVKKVAFELGAPIGKAEAETVFVSFRAEDPSTFDLDFSAAVKILQENLKINGSTLAKLSDLLEVSFDQLQIFAESDAFLGQLEQDPEGKHYLGSATYTLNPEQSRALVDGAVLLRPMTISLSLHHFDPTSLDFSGRLHVDEVLVDKGYLENLTLPFSYKGNTEVFEATLSGYTNSGDNGLVGRVHITHFLEHPSEWAAKGSLKARQFPTALFNRRDLSNLMGPTFDLDIQMTEEKGEETINFDLASESLRLQGDLFVNDAVRLSDREKPIRFEIDLSPARFKELKLAFPKLELGTGIRENLKVSGQIWELQVPTKSWKNGAFSVNVESNFLPIYNLPIQATTLHIHTPDWQKGLLFQLSADKLSLKGEIIEKKINIKGEASEVPLRVLGNFPVFEPGMIAQLEALVGSKLNTSFHLFLENFVGAVELDIKGEIGKLSLAGNLNPQGLTLKTPLRAEFIVTDRLTGAYLDELLPFLDSAIKSERPIVLTIQPEGFFYPIWTHDLRALTIGSMAVDLGKIYFKTDQQIGEVLSLLNFATEEGFVTVWFTPMYVSFQNGVAKVQRLDMLIADRFPMALWGNVDFFNDKVSMKVGLGGQTLGQAFGLRGIPKDFYLQLNLRGTLKNAVIDRNAKTDMAAFVAQLKRSGPQGALIGGFLDLIGGGWGQKKTPKPTTQPFPWETL